MKKFFMTGDWKLKVQMLLNVYPVQDIGKKHGSIIRDAIAEFLSSDDSAANIGSRRLYITL